VVALNAVDGIIIKHIGFRQGEIPANPARLTNCGTFLLNVLLSPTSLLWYNYLFPGLTSLIVYGSALLAEIQKCSEMFLLLESET
jgi:hypothetical protein